MATYLQGQQADRVFVNGEEAAFVFGRGTQVFPNAPLELSGWTQTRVVLDSAERWFEVGFKLDHELVGNPAAGWTDTGNYLKLDLQWSQELVSWSFGKFVPAPVPVVDLGGGVFEYWARAVNPVDSAVKTGALVCSISNGDARNNPLTSVIIAGVVQTLPRFPYYMPGDASKLQEDLIAKGFAGTTVTAPSATTWTISIPSVNYTAFAQSSRVGWPGYLVPDMYGNLTNTSDGLGFQGTFVNAAGVPIYTRAFARLKISGGTRYNAFLP